MSEKLPAPDFDSLNYARPNQNWMCGHACEGKPCRPGPDNKGRCQATFECQPALETKPGETKGRWRCTRPGGACESGPLPDGTCCRPIPKCSPVPTLRKRRGQLTWAVVAATVALLLIALGGSWRGELINPGDLSSAHSGDAFVRLLIATNHVEQSCAACHTVGASGPSGIVNAAFRASPGPLQVIQLASVEKAAMTTIDANCQKCHLSHSFHQPNTARDVSCSFCHQEHKGSGKMLTTVSADCTLCHGDAATLAAATARGQNLPTDTFHYRVPANVNTFVEPRPASGFTEVIHGFADDHPEFRLHTDQLRDPDTLKFGHALHLTSSTIPLLPDGHKLDCAFCHQPDAAGAYMQPVNFEKDCRVCHSLQFDPETPELHLPHGNHDFISAFLRSLPKQYADLAARSGISGIDEQNRFAQQKLERLRGQIESGEALEKRIFFSTAIQGPSVDVGTVTGATRALYPGCAYCHDVEPAAEGRPVITEPVMFDRWFVHARFDHSKHSSMECSQCHDATGSKETADIILPAKVTCIACHSPRGGVGDSCATCHTYHNPPVK